MDHRTTLLAVALTVGIAAGSTLVWGLGPLSPGFVQQVLFPAGSTLRFPGFGSVSFEVPREGGVLVGAASVDHTSLELGWCQAGHCTAACGLITPNFTFSGPAWSYSVHVQLAPGHYFWGAHCYDFGNVTFTQPLEIVAP